MSTRAALIVLAVALPFIVLGAWLWSREGVLVWLQDAIRTCF